MKTIFDVAYDKNDNNKVDFYLPESKQFDLIIWFHGGGITDGSRKDIAFAQDMVANNVAVASVEYSLYPNAKFPQFIEDSAKAVKFCMEFIGQYRTSGKTHVSGQSAGAYITLMLCLDKHYLTDAGVDRKEISCYVSDSAQTTTHFNVLAEMGIDSELERIDQRAPLFFVDKTADFKSLLLLCYEKDMWCRVTQNKLLYESLLRNYPNGKVQMKVLSGSHVHGSTERNEKGTFDYVDETIKFIAE